MSFLQLFLAVRDRHHNFVPLLLNLRQFKLHHISQQLVLQSFKSDAEVDDCHFDVDLGQVDRVAHLSCEEHLEVLVEVEVIARNLN